MLINRSTLLFTPFYPNLAYPRFSNILRTVRLLTTYLEMNTARILLHLKIVTNSARPMHKATYNLRVYRRRLRIFSELISTLERFFIYFI